MAVGMVKAFDLLCWKQAAFLFGFNWFHLNSHPDLAYTCCDQSPMASQFLPFLLQHWRWCWLARFSRIMTSTPYVFWWSSTPPRSSMCWLPIIRVAVKGVCQQCSSSWPCKNWHAVLSAWWMRSIRWDAPTLPLPVLYSRRNLWLSSWKKNGERPNFSMCIAILCNWLFVSVLNIEPGLVKFLANSLPTYSVF